MRNLGDVVFVINNCKIVACIIVGITVETSIPYVGCEDFEVKETQYKVSELYNNGETGTYSYFTKAETVFDNISEAKHALCDAVTNAKNEARKNHKEE